MLLLRCAILLLVILINDQNWIAGNAIELLTLNDKNGILNAIEHRIQFERKYDSKKEDRKDNSNNWNRDQFCRSKTENEINDEKSFFDVFTSTYDENNSIANIHCGTSTTHSLDMQLENVIHHLNKKLNIGDKFELNTDAIDITLEKVSSDNITGKYLSQSIGTEVRFPELNLNQTTTINLITLPSASIVSLTLHDQSGEIINIKNTTNPFEILIPHSNNHLMPPMIRQNVTSSLKNIKFKYHYINLTHHSNSSIALHIEIEPENANLSYLLIVRFSGVPNLQSNLLGERKLLCPKDRENHSSKYTHFIDNNRISHHQWAIIGIRELPECIEDDLNNPIQFSSDYSMRMYTSGCYYLDKNHHWQSDGIIVGSKTNERFTQCYSTHLTTFAGGFIVLPNPIDWNSLQTDFSNNLTIYLTLIILGLLYFATMGFAYYKDQIDAQMLMVIPLQDNNQRDTYLYQLVVFTGMRANAGTKSQVHLILSGDADETTIRTLTADRRIFARGSTDSFIMAVPRNLGRLNYLRIWHDNSGLDSDASWYLKYILVRDLQTMETSYFICEKWLAVEENLGEIDRTIGAAGELDKMELKHLLSKNAYRSMADNHLWFSIFAYHLPSARRFTRVQRCTCCFVLFLMSLMMNVLYFDIRKDFENNQLDQFGVEIGPFHLSKDAISVSVISELIIFFPSLLLVALFRRSKARRPRAISPVAEAIQNIRPYKSSTGNNPSKEKKFLFPWWCLILAYVLSFLIVVTSVFFILIRCFQYGDAKTRQWLGTILTNFFTSVILTQPLKVLSLALLFMCFCRKKSQHDAFIEHEDPIEDFTVSTKDAHRKFPAKSLLAKTRLDPYRAKREKSALRKLRELRLKELKAWFILRELFFLMLFLGILYAISFANRDVDNAHHMVSHLRRQFLALDHHHQYKYLVKKEDEKKKSYVFENIRTIKDYWNWLENVFASRYLLTTWKDKKEDKAGLLNATRANQILGFPTLRQLRVKNDSCPRKVLHGHMEIDDCNLPYTWYNEGKEPFGSNGSENIRWEYRNPFKYTEAEDRTLVYSTTYATYMAGGYIHEIRGRSAGQIITRLQRLRDYRWIDRYTRAIFLTFGLYNPNTNLFVHCSLLLEQLPITNELIARASFQPFKLVQLYTGTDLIYCLIYLILIIYYMYTEVKLIFEMRKAYIKQFWSYINWGIIICSWFGVVIHIFRQAEVKKLAEALKHKENKIVSLQFFSYLDSLLTYLLGFCCFFGTIKILRLLRFNRRLSLLHLTLQKSARQILGFLLVFSFVFTAFTTLFYFLFHSQIKSYATWLDTALTCFEMISLHFTTVSDLTRVNPLLAGLCLFLFIFLAVFLLSNMFISIIVDNFNLVRQEQLNKANDVEMIQFIVGKMKQYLGLRSRQREMEKNKNPALAFPGKMNQLTRAIDKFYKNQN